MKKLFVAQLLWKDCRLLLPLVVFIFGTAVILNFVRPEDIENYDIRLLATEKWFLVPHLFALLAPLILVGTDQDSKTLGWLRQFPVRDRQIIASRQAAAAIGLISVWLFCLANYLAICAYEKQPFIDPIIQENPAKATVQFFQQNTLTGQSGLTEVLEKTLIADIVHRSRLDQLCYLTASGEDGPRWTPNLIYHALQTGLSSVVWMLVSFSLNHLIRQPIIASIPIVIVGLGTTLVTTVDSRYDFLLTHIVGIGKPGYMFAFVATVIGLGLFNQVIARHQLKRKEDSRTLILFIANLLSQQDKAGPQTDLQAQRIWRSLLWQQYQQIRGPIRVWFCLIAIILLGSILSRRIPFLDPFFGPGLSTLAVSIASLSLGVLCFYQDNCQKTKAFLAERGITPSFVWWTRVLPPFAAFALIAMIHLIVSPSLDSHYIPSLPHTHAVFFLLFFASGALVSQSIERPIFAFLVTPCHAFFISGVLQIWSWDYVFTGVIASGILLWGSWKLSHRWMDGRINLRFASHVVAYTALAIVPWILLNLLSDAA